MSAWREGKKFEVFVVDASPFYHGKTLLHKLQENVSILFFFSFCSFWCFFLFFFVFLTPSLPLLFIELGFEMQLFSPYRCHFCHEESLQGFLDSIFSYFLFFPLLLYSMKPTKPNHTKKKVFLGVSCLMSNGNAMARAGTSLVAMAAKSLGVPVLVCCESLKFTEKVCLFVLLPLLNYFLTYFRFFLL